MAILLVKIEDEKSLAFNEFFDYNGYCYGATCSRKRTDDNIIDMTSFYEATITTESLKDIPVVFVSVETEEAKEEANVLGWYKKAEIFSEMRTPSLFLEGNILAKSQDAVWLPKEEQTRHFYWFARKQFYEVIEEEDIRFLPLQKMMREYSGKNQMLRYHEASPFVQTQGRKDLKFYQLACEQWASLVIEEKCQDIRDIKTMEAYAKKLCEKAPKDPDGYYYYALACYHLGLVKEGIKQINKALNLEEDASDLIALKGMLLVSRGYAEDGANLLHEAYLISADETYLLTEGRVWMIAGKADLAYDCFDRIEDKSLLEEMNIRSKDMENKWNFIKTRYMKFRDMFSKKTE